MISLILYLATPKAEGLMTRELNTEILLGGRPCERGQMIALERQCPRQATSGLLPRAGVAPCVAAARRQTGPALGPQGGLA